MLFLLKLLFLLFLIQKNTTASQDNYINIFKETLSGYNIMYDSLKSFKSGAICIPHKVDKVFTKYAVGFSFNMHKKKNAELIALEGCKKMKKKIISYDCKCEIIL